MPAAETNVMSLAECLSYADAHARDLARQRIAVDSRKLATRIQKAKFALQLTGDANRRFEAARTSAGAGLKREVAGGLTVDVGVDVEDADDDTRDTGSLSVSLSKIILGGGSVRASRLEIDNALLDEIVTMNELSRSERDLAFQVRRAYYGIIRDYQTLKVRELRLERARRNLEHALERDRPLDIAIAQIEVPDTEADLLRARRAVESSLDGMKVLIGMDVAKAFDIDRSFAFRPETVEVNHDIRYSFLHDERILNAGLEQEKQENSAYVDKTRRLPRVTLNGGAEQGSEDGIDFAGDPEYRAGVALSWNVGSTAERARYRRALNGIEQQRIEIEDLRQGKAREVRNLGRRLDEAARVIELQEERVKFQERRVALYADRWENGEVDILEYVRSQSDLENTRIQLINSKTSYMELLSEYRFTVGR